VFVTGKARLQPYPQALDKAGKAGKAFQGQTLETFEKYT
jgi:hypothetical protein